MLDLLIHIHEVLVVVPGLKVLVLILDCNLLTIIEFFLNLETKYVSPVSDSIDLNVINHVNNLCCMGYNVSSISTIYIYIMFTYLCIIIIRYDEMSGRSQVTSTCVVECALKYILMLSSSCWGVTCTFTEQITS